MPVYHVSIVNEHFSSTNKHDCEGEEDAWTYAIRAALNIAAEQVSHGNPYFGAEVTLKQGRRRIARYVVSAGASPLKD